MPQVVVEMTAEEAQLFTAMSKIVGKQREMETGFKRTGRRSKEAGDQAEKSFGAPLIGKLGAAAAAFVGVSKAIGVVSESLRNMAVERDAAGKRLQAGAAGIGELYALSAQANLDIVPGAKEIHRRGGAPDIDSAAKLEFALQSQDVAQYRDLAIDIAKSHVIKEQSELVDVIDAAAAVSATFKGDPAGNVEDIISKGLGANKMGTGTTPALLKALADAAASADALGLTDEETLAAVSTLSKAVGADEAGTQAKSLFTALNLMEEPLEGATLAEKIESFRARGLTFAETKGEFGRQEATSAIDTLLKNPDLLKQNLTNIETAQREQTLRTQIDAALADPDVGAAAALAEATGGKEAVMEPIGRTATLADALAEFMEEEAFRRFGTGMMGQAAAEKARRGAKFYRGTLGDEFFIQKEFLGTSFENVREYQPRLFEQLTEYVGVDSEGRPVPNTPGVSPVTLPVGPPIEEPPPPPQPAGPDLPPGYGAASPPARRSPADYAPAAPLPAAEQRQLTQQQIRQLELIREAAEKQLQADYLNGRRRPTPAPSSRASQLAERNAETP